MMNTAAQKANATAAPDQNVLNFHKSLTERRISAKERRVYTTRPEERNEAKAENENENEKQEAASMKYRAAKKALIAGES